MLLFYILKPYLYQELHYLQENIIVKSSEKQGREPVRTGYIHYIDESHKMIKIRKCEKGHIASFM